MSCTCIEFGDYWIKLSNFIKICVTYNTSTVDPIWFIFKLTHCSSHEHRSFLFQMCPAIPVDLGRFGRLLARIARKVTNCGQFNHRIQLRRLLSYAIFFMRPLPHPLSVSSKKEKEFHFFLFFLFWREVFCAFLSHSVGVRQVCHPSRALSARVSSFPRMWFCVGCSHPDFVRAENSTTCVVSASSLVVSGGG